MKNLNLVMMVLGLILTGCNSTTSTPDAAPVAPTNPTTNYGSHILFVANSGSVYSYTIDSTTGFPKQNSISGIFEPNWGTPAPGDQCSIKMSPLGNYLFTACNTRSGFQEYSINTENGGLLTEVGTFNVGLISSNYNADALAFATDGTLYVHVTENIGPYTEQVIEVPFDESTNTIGSGTFVTSGYPSFEFTTTAQLDDVTYEINANTLAVDLDRDGQFTDSMSFGTNHTPTSLAIK